MKKANVKTVVGGVVNYHHVGPFDEVKNSTVGLIFYKDKQEVAIFVHGYLMSVEINSYEIQEAPAEPLPVEAAPIQDSVEF